MPPASDLSRAVRDPIVEYRTYEQPKVRPDIKAVETHGGAGSYDVTFFNPRASSCIGQLLKHLLAALNRAGFREFARLQGFI